MLKHKALFILALMMPTAILAENCVDPTSMLVAPTSEWELFNDTPAKISSDRVAAIYSLILPTDADEAVIDTSKSEIVSIRLERAQADGVRSLIEQANQIGLGMLGPMKYPLMAGSDMNNITTVIGDVVIYVEGNGSGSAFYFEQILSCALASGMLPIASFETPARSGKIDTSIDFTALSRDDYLEEADNLLRATWDSTFELFGRTDPSIAALIPDYVYSNEFRAVNGCVYDRLRDQGALQDLNIIRDNAVVGAAYLRAHPELTVFTMTDHQGYLDPMVPPDAYLEAADDCGLLNLNVRIISDAGIWEALKAVTDGQN